MAAFRGKQGKSAQSSLISLLSIFFHYCSLNKNTTHSKAGKYEDIEHVCQCHDVTDVDGTTVVMENCNND